MKSRRGQSLVKSVKRKFSGLVPEKKSRTDQRRAAILKPKSKIMKRQSSNTRIYGITPSKRNRKAKALNVQNWSKKKLFRVATSQYKRAVERGEIPGEFDNNGKVIIPE